MIHELLDQKSILTILFMSACILMPSHTLSEVIIYFEYNNPPYMYEEKGELKGLYTEIVMVAFRRMKEPATLSSAPWKRIIAGVDAGSWGVAGIYMNEKRMLKYDYSEPIFEDTIKAYVLCENQFEFSGVHDMTGKTVGVMRGWSYGASFDNAVAAGKIMTSEVNDDHVNIRLLLLGRLDAILMTTDTWAMFRKFDPEKRICELSPPLIVNKTYLAFPKSMDKTILLNKFNAEIRAMRKEGVIAQLAQDYLH